MSIENNFQKLVNDAVDSNAPNEMLEPVSKAVTARATVLTNIAKTNASGNEPSDTQKAEIYKEAREWVKTNWAKEQLHELVGGGKEKGNETVEKADKLWGILGDFSESPIKGIFSLLKNFKNIIPAFTEYKDAKGQDKDFFKILDKYERNDKLNAFAEKHGISARELLSQLENPPTVSATKKPDELPPKAKEKVEVVKKDCKEAGVDGCKEADHENKSPASAVVQGQPKSKTP